MQSDSSAMFCKLGQIIVKSKSTLQDTPIAFETPALTEVGVDEQRSRLEASQDCDRGTGNSSTNFLYKIFCALNVPLSPLITWFPRQSGSKPACRRAGASQIQAHQHHPMHHPHQERHRELIETTL